MTPNGRKFHPEGRAPRDNASPLSLLHAVAEGVAGGGVAELCGVYKGAQDAAVFVGIAGAEGAVEAGVAGAEEVLTRVLGGSMAPPP